MTPDCIELLAEVCRESSPGNVAARLGYSPAALGAILAGRYQGDLAIFRNRLLANLPDLNPQPQAPAKGRSGRKPAPRLDLRLLAISGALSAPRRRRRLAGLRQLLHRIFCKRLQAK